MVRDLEYKKDAASHWTSFTVLVDACGVEEKPESFFVCEAKNVHVGVGGVRLRIWFSFGNVGLSFRMNCVNCVVGSGLVFFFFFSLYRASLASANEQHRSG